MLYSNRASCTVNSLYSPGTGHATSPPSHSPCRMSALKFSLASSWRKTVQTLLIVKALEASLHHVTVWGMTALHLQPLNYIVKLQDPHLLELIPDFGGPWAESSQPPPPQPTHLITCLLILPLPCCQALRLPMRTHTHLYCLLWGPWAAGSMSNGVLTNEQVGKELVAVDPAKSTGAQQLPHLRAWWCWPSLTHFSQAFCCGSILYPEVIFLSMEKSCNCSVREESFLSPVSSGNLVSTLWRSIFQQSFPRIPKFTPKHRLHWDIKNAPLVQHTGI